MATTTPNFGWTVPTSTDLVKDGATAIETLGDGIDASFVDLKGGTTGQVLSKASGTDLDFTWVAQDDSNAIQNAIVDAKGDLIAATAADTPARLAVGTNGQILTADSTAATGLKWVTAAGGGKILQVVSTKVTTTFTTTSSTLVDATNFTLSITPTSSTSKILVMMDLYAYQYVSGNNNQLSYGALFRGSTNIYAGSLNWLALPSSGSIEIGSRHPYIYLDSPATTSSTTYKIQVARGDSGTLVMNGGGSGTNSTITLLEVGA